MKAWESFLQSMILKLGKATVDKWLLPLKVVTFDARNLTVSVPTPFHYSWFTQQGLPVFMAQFPSITVHIKHSQEEASISPDPVLFETLPLNAMESFENFWGNPFVVSYLSSLDERAENPIYLQGVKHSGKSHLLNALALLQMKKGKKVIFATARMFMEHFVQALKKNNMAQFRKFYRSPDILILDNIDYFQGKNATQEEFFHTLNTLITKQKKVLLASSLLPNQLLGIEDRLTSRFAWGLLLTLTPPDAQQAKKILYTHAFNSIPVLEQEAFAWLCQQPFSLEQSLKIIINCKITEFTNKYVSLKTLQEKSKSYSPCVNTEQRIIEQVAKHFSIRKECLWSEAQTREFSYPRHISIFLCRKMLHTSYKSLGKIFKRDPSTIIASIRKAKKEIEKGTPFSIDIQKIEEAISSSPLNN